MKKIIFLLLITLLTVAPCSTAHARSFLYIQTCIVTELYPEDDIVILTEYDKNGINGDEWYWYDADDIELFDCFYLIIDDNGTMTKSDDKILQLQFIG